MNQQLCSGDKAAENYFPVVAQLGCLLRDPSENCFGSVSVETQQLDSTFSADTVSNQIVDIVEPSATTEPDIRNRAKREKIVSKLSATVCKDT